MNETATRAQGADARGGEMAPEPAGLELRRADEPPRAAGWVLQNGEPATLLRFGNPDSVTPGLGLRELDGQA